MVLSVRTQAHDSGAHFNVKTPTTILLRAKTINTCSSVAYDPTFDGCEYNVTAVVVVHHPSFGESLHCNATCNVCVAFANVAKL